jgi:hypothetical protein
MRALPYGFFFRAGHGSGQTIRRNEMQYRKFSIAALAIGYAALTVSPALAFDIGGGNGGLSINNNGGKGLGVSLGGANGINANVNTSNGLGVGASVGGSSGVNANAGLSSSSGVGLGASVGGSSGVNTTASVSSKSSGGLGAGVNAGVGGSSGLNANVGAGVDRNGVNARTTATLGGRTLLDLMIGVPGTTPNNPNPGPNPGPNPSPNPRDRDNANNGNNRNRAQLAAYNDMSTVEQTKMKIRCRDVVRGGGFDASLVKLCKMVLALN